MWHINCYFYRIGARQLNQISKILDDAIAAHEEENFLQAADLYLQILKDNPNQPDANHNLGLLSVHTGKAREGIHFFENAINSNPTVSTYWLSLLNTLISLKELKEAKNILEQATAMGHKSRDFSKIHHFLKELKCRNNNEISEFQLTELYSFLEKKRFKRFQTKIKKYSKKYPNSIKLKEAEVQAFCHFKKYSSMCLKLKEILALYPDSLKHLLQLGSLSLKMKEYDQAISTFSMALKIDPRNPRTNYNLGVAYSAIHKFKESIAFYEKSFLLNPENAETLISLGNLYAEVGKIEQAIDMLRKSVAIAPLKFEANFNLGHLLSTSGNYSEARKYFFRALEIYPKNPLTHQALSSLIDYKSDNTHLKKMEKIILLEKLDTKSEAIFNFSIAKAYEELGNCEKAFEHYKTANLLQHENSDYCSTKEKQFFAALKDLGSKVKGQIPIKLPLKRSLVPIFIVGMPRSGTSLVEQILTAHTKISGGGELKSLSNFGNLIIDKKLIYSQQQVDIFRENYFQELSSFAGENTNFVTDKLPHNFRFIPLIKLLFPESKIIHVKRDPSATCWSNYARYFNDGSLEYSYDLTNLVDFYLMYEDLMNLWSKNFPNTFYDLNYEQLVSDCHSEIRKILEYIGTDFEKACTRPHENKRVVKTSSNKQVRKKIYRGSSLAWKKYEPFLENAFDRLPKFYTN